jgi:hypothetical protein
VKGREKRGKGIERKGAEGKGRRGMNRGWEGCEYVYDSSLLSHYRATLPIGIVNSKFDVTELLKVHNFLKINGIRH